METTGGPAGKTSKSAGPHPLSKDVLGFDDDDDDDDEDDDLEVFSKDDDHGICREITDAEIVYSLKETDTAEDVNEDVPELEIPTVRECCALRMMNGKGTKAIARAWRREIILVYGHSNGKEQRSFLEQEGTDASFTDASSFSISMPTSPSSMINQHTLEDEPEGKDLFVTVDDPENHITAIETFVTYRITAKTTRSEFDSCEYAVRRRYQDFLWLKDKLEEAHSTLIIPPLPEKFVMRGMVERFNEDFIETRRKALHKFLNRIADHSTLSFNEDFKIFLTAQAWELTAHKKLGPGFISKMGETVRAVAGTGRSVKNRPDEFTAMSDYVDIFRQKMRTLDKISQRILKELKEHLVEMREYSPIYTLWSGSEQELSEPLKGVASSIENCCKATGGLTMGLTENLLPALHEYVLCAETLKSVLKRRDLIQAEYDSQIDAIAHKKAEREMLEHSNPTFTFGAFLGKSTEEVKQQKQQKIDREIDECLATWESFLASQQTEINTDKNVKDSV
ncbi:sorting nexin-7 isoform X4 [Heptranchias perlo]|uniref:sorting nexin-7 isoform X4 n=1 Tax=Heptranchias perlo TaxID=212740 RepID=UPI00355ABFB1